MMLYNAAQEAMWTLNDYRGLDRNEIDYAECLDHLDKALENLLFSIAEQDILVAEMLDNRLRPSHDKVEELRKQ